ncbi:MAG: hypothetical protein M3Q55_03865 [Acidobacteriota bacterium]|nr:hypothetical protein [Acidobacteriota bacterium]
MRLTGKLLLTILLALAPFSGAQQTILAQASTTPAAAALQPYAVEYYYKVKWGYFEEFLDLYMKNHYPILQKLQQDGEILSMSAAYPRNHASEPARWDMRFTIVYRDVVAAHAETGMATVVALYPDQEKFKKEEQRRFELLLEHTDIPIVVDDLKDWKR